MRRWAVGAEVTRHRAHRARSRLARARLGPRATLGRGRRRRRHRARHGGRRSAPDGGRRSRVRSADLATLQPWLPIVGQLRGSADADVTTTVALEPFAVTLRGTLGAAKLAFLDRDRPLITVERVEVAGVDAAVADEARDRPAPRDRALGPDRAGSAGQLSLRALFARRPDRPMPPGDASVVLGPWPDPGSSAERPRGHLRQRRLQHRRRLRSSLPPASRCAARTSPCAT